LNRIVRFGDVDSAGVIHFYQLLRWSHEAWEESLDCYGLSVHEVFPCASSEFANPKIALPIVHCRADFRHPIRIGDRLVVELRPERIDLSIFQVQTTFLRGDVVVAQGILRHLAINSDNRQRCAMPKDIQLWLEASSLNQGLQVI